MKQWQRILSALMLETALTASFAAEAAIDTGKLPLQTFVAKRVYCGNSAGAVSNSYWIDAERDLVTIKRYQGDWAYGTYPNSKGQPVTRWFRMSDVLPNIGFANYETGMKHRQAVYRTQLSSATIGTVFNTDKVVVVGESNGRTQIIYSLSNGKGYKMGWVPDSTINKRSNTAYSSSSARTDQPQLNMGVNNPVISSYLNSNDSKVEPPKNSNYNAWQGVASVRATAYLNSGLTKTNRIEWVGKGDTITILGDEGNAYFVEYPLTKGGTKHRWIRKNVVAKTTTTNNNVNTGSAIASAAQKAAQAAANAGNRNSGDFSYLNSYDVNVERPSNANYSTWKSVANIRATAYLNSSLTKTSSIEWVGKGDTVTVYGEQGNAYFVEYPLSKGGVKHRWVRKNVINNSSSNNNIMNASGDIVKLNVPKYSQYDSRWKDTYIGNKTIGKVGCLVTSLAMKYSYETGQTVYPNQMKDLLTFNNNDLCWSSVRKLGYTDRDMTFNISLAKEIYNALLNNKPVVTGNTSKHWVVIIGCANNNADNLKASDFLIIDPYYDNIKNLQGFFNKIGTTRGKVIY